MKRKAFTLVELMVVMAIIALLVVIILPSMTKVQSVARATICRGNLQKLGSAFAIANQGRVISNTSGTALGGVYPVPMIWPATPRSAVDDAVLYHCPEDPNRGQPDTGNMFKHLQYQSVNGVFTLDVLNGPASSYKAQAGMDPVKGPYVDFLLEDDIGNGQYEMMDFHGWLDTDGVMRVYFTGDVFVYDTIPNTPEWAYTNTAYGPGPGRPSSINTCGDINNILWQGKPGWGSDGSLKSWRGKTVKLAGWDPGFTNYGISSEIHRYPYGTKAIVLVDYKELIVDLDVPKDAETKLADPHSARHMGRLNVLYGDGSVGNQTPMAISPRLNPKAWQP